MSTPKELKMNMPKHALGDVVARRSKVVAHPAGHLPAPRTAPVTSATARTSIRSRRPTTKKGG